MNKELLKHWVENGLATEDCGDGAWGWLSSGFDRTTLSVRMILLHILYGTMLEDPTSWYVRWQIKTLEENGFTKEGFLKEKEST